MGNMDEDCEDDELALGAVGSGTGDALARVRNAMGSMDDDDEDDELVAVAAGGGITDVESAVRSAERQMAL